MRHLVLVCLAASCGALAIPAHAGTFFRLEVGPPVAAGTAVKDRKTAFVVRPRLCDDVAAVSITGTAEGYVAGRRETIPLRIVPLATPGVHAVAQQWTGEGPWLIHLTARCAATAAVTSALVPVNGPSFVRHRIELLPRAATRQQVEAALASWARHP
jgi:hypothetical protein